MSAWINDVLNEDFETRLWGRLVPKQCVDNPLNSFLLEDVHTAMESQKSCELAELLKRTEENKEARKQERLDGYNRRNFKVVDVEFLCNGCVVLISIMCTICCSLLFCLATIGS